MILPQQVVMIVIRHSKAPFSNIQRMVEFIFGLILFDCLLVGKFLMFFKCDVENYDGNGVNAYHEGDDVIDDLLVFAISPSILDLHLHFELLPWFVNNNLLYRVNVQSVKQNNVFELLPNCARIFPAKGKNLKSLSRCPLKKCSRRRHMNWELPAFGPSQKSCVGGDRMFSMKDFEILFRALL